MLFGAVGVGAVLNRDYGHDLLADPVKDAEVAPASAVQPLQLEPEPPAHAMRVLGKGTVDEFDNGGGDLLRQASQGTS